MRRDNIKSCALVGFGKFGKQYYRELCNLENLKFLNLKAVITLKNNYKEIKHDQFLYDSKYAKKIISEVDFCIVVTPSNSHCALICELIKYTNVIIEKPICLNINEVKKINESVRNSNNTLTVAQIYRFHPLIKLFKKENENLKPSNIHGVFLNPNFEGNNSLNPSLEMIHLIDLSIFIFGENNFQFGHIINNNINEVIYSHFNNRGITAKFESGWHDKNIKIRKLDIVYDKFSIILDFVDSNYELIENNNKESRHLIFEYSLINKFLVDYIEQFDKCIKSQTLSTFESSKKIISEYHKVLNKNKTNYPTKVPKIGIIGGGIFGCTLSLELAKTSDVYLFEKSSSILDSASSLNQLRHHSGFHYPLSYETALEINKTKKDFEDIFKEFIFDNVTSYYAVSSLAEEIPKERYLSACNLYNLNFEIVKPPKYFSEKMISVCLRTDESVYDIKNIKRYFKESISSTNNIKTFFNKNVTSIDVLENYKKKIIFDESSDFDVGDFDYVIDATYGLGGINKNFVFNSSSFIREELVELLKLYIPIENVSLTVIDGPFVSLTSTGIKNEFILSHKDHSLHHRQFINNEDLLFKTHNVNTPTSKKDLLLKAGRNYFNCFDNFEFIESIFIKKGISPYPREFWERPTLIKDNGFGVYSIIGGKILTSVSNARELTKNILSSWNGSIYNNTSTYL